MIPKSTRVSAIISQIKNHPTVIAVIFFGTVVISLSTFTDHLKNLIGVITPGYSPETARAELSRLSLPYTKDVFIDRAGQGDLHAVKLFVAARMDPNATNGRADALSEAVRGGHIEVVQALVEAKARISASDLGVAWRQAGEIENSDMLRVLLDGGLDAEEMNSAFAYAATGARRDMLRVLLEKGVDVNVVGREALWSASGSPVKGQALFGPAEVTDAEKNETVLFLLDRGVDVNAKKEDGFTPLHFAAQSGSPATVHTLLTRGAEVNVFTEVNGGGSRRHDRTPLMMALAKYDSAPKNKESEEIVRALLAKGADVNARGLGGNTALMIAVSLRNARIVATLLDAGARAEDKDDSGRTALTFANNNREEGEEIVRLLQMAETQTGDAGESRMR